MTGTEFKAIRTRLGYTQATLAQKLKKSPTTIARWESPSCPGRYPVPTWASLILTLWQENVQEDKS